MKESYFRGFDKRYFRTFAREYHRQFHLPPSPPSPDITLLAPTTLTPAGGALTITGTNFVAGSTAYIDDVAMVVVVTPTTSIAATVPAIAAGPHLITVRTPSPDNQTSTGIPFPIA